MHKIQKVSKGCLVFLLAILIGCTKSKDDQSLSIALSITDVIHNSATAQLKLNVGITEADIEKIGIVYGVSPDPVIDIQTTMALTDLSKMKVVINNLEPQKTYHIRAFVKLKNDDLKYSADSLFQTFASTDFEPTDVVNQYEGYKLVWADEFNEAGRPSSDWTYESGYVRNHEAQYYTVDNSENAAIIDKCLLITARKNHAGHSYTSASLNTSNSKSFMYGRFEIRAKIPTGRGAWPAIWTLGNKYEWPNNGEIDIMEYYKEGILANACWGSTQRWVGIWDSMNTPIFDFEANDPQWRKKFHLWRMDWDFDNIKIYLDGKLLNTIELVKTVNPLDNKNPFRSQDKDFGAYILLNLALGGDNGGPIDDSLFPMEYKIDYVRVYQ